MEQPLAKIVLSSCVSRIEESPTLAITAKALKLKSEGKDIIGLAAGEPDFDTPEFIKEAAIKAIKSGFTKYTEVSGMPSLKSAIVEKFKNENGLDFRTDEIIVGVGGKQCIFNLCFRVCVSVSVFDVVVLTEHSPNHDICNNFRKQEPISLVHFETRFSYIFF